MLRLIGFSENMNFSSIDNEHQQKKNNFRLFSLFGRTGEHEKSVRAGSQHAYDMIHIILKSERESSVRSTYCIY